MSDTKMLSREAVIAIVSIREFDLPLTRSEANKILESDQLQRDRITELEGRLSRLDEDVRIAIGSTPGGREALGSLLDAAPFDAPAALNRYAVWARETIDGLVGERDEAVKKVSELGEQLEHDRSLVAACVTSAKEAVTVRDWLMEGRGPYEWNDDRWHKEFYAAAKEFLDAIEPMRRVAQNWKDCPMDGAAVAQARIDLKDELAALRLRLDSLTIPAVVKVGTSVLTRDLVWCECKRGISRNGFWNFCPGCGHPIDQESYRVACGEAHKAMATKFIGPEEQLELIRGEVEGLRLRLVEAVKETERLDYTLDNRCIVIDGSATAATARDGSPSDQTTRGEESVRGPGANDSTESTLASTLNDSAASESTGPAVQPKEDPLYRIIMQICESLKCEAPDRNGLGCAPLLAALVEVENLKFTTGPAPTKEKKK